jgi:hypothetical protein
MPSAAPHNLPEGDRFSAHLTTFQIFHRGGIGMRAIKKITIFLVLGIFAFSTVGFAADKGIFKTTPNLKDGKKWRIGYYEGGPYIDYQWIFAETVKALMKMGWIEEAMLPKLTGEETSGLWKWLATEAKSNYLEFVKDAHYNAMWEDQLIEWTHKCKNSIYISMIR